MKQKAQNISIRNISGSATDEELTAILMAINLYYNGGCEDKKLTFKNNTSTSWNSKIFGMNQLTK
ncbi:MAG: hypothetical protein IKO90_03270 [Bacteroidales bacterium]|nr:hypothetical protein [Bacteroidales bacterium]MBR4689467.1 hypothetical protein [Bacteroidales bacterium]MBR7035020.1 hypothetical protein [Bacteroidales bacterium]